MLHYRIQIRRRTAASTLNVARRARDQAVPTAQPAAQATLKHSPRFMTTTKISPAQAHSHPHPAHGTKHDIAYSVLTRNASWRLAVAAAASLLLWLVVAWAIA